MTEKIKALRTIHLALCAGVIMAYFVLGNLSLETLKLPSMTSSSLVFFAIPIAAFFISNFFFKSTLKKADLQKKWEDNLAIFQTASIIRWAILEGAAFLILILKPDMMLLGLLVILYIIYLHPTEDRIKQELQVSK